MAERRWILVEITTMLVFLVLGGVALALGYVELGVLVLAIPALMIFFYWRLRR